MQTKKFKLLYYVHFGILCTRLLQALLMIILEIWKEKRLRLGINDVLCQCLKLGDINIGTMGLCCVHTIPWKTYKEHENSAVHLHAGTHF